MKVGTNPAVLDAPQTAKRLPYKALTDAIKATLLSSSVNVPARDIYSTSGGNRFFVMPAFDEEVVITKLISHAPQNPSCGLPAIVGQVMVFDAKTGLCRLILDGPTVTARRTAAVSGLFLRQLHRPSFNHCLIVGAGVQGESHLEMLRALLTVKAVSVVSRSINSAKRLAGYAVSIGLTAIVLSELPNTLEAFDLIITCTPAQEAVMMKRPRSDAVICAIGSYTPNMLEWDPEIVRWIAATGQVIVDSRDADHEAGDLIQAGLSPAGYPCLGDVIRRETMVNASATQGPILFKSCGWGGWDLAAARCAMRESS
ncbi:delta(1)-pyrroline-2-carboxylate reductase family protein [Betaproteobacteria bacterium LSUCC0115]|nr:delta(1)-pyrroline-2-carboxylate reductase family protein [Burkholderiales bacterium LSUCC0115]